MALPARALLHGRGKGGGLIETGAPIARGLQELRAVRLTTEAARRLGRARGTGTVHSAFARTVNVALHGLGDAGWVSLHGPGPIPAPFGIACERPPAAEGLAGEPVRREAGAVVLGGRLRIRLDRAALCDAALPAASPAPSPARCVRVALAGASGGLLPAAAAVLARARAPSDPLSRMAHPALARMHAATRARDAAGCLGAARPLLGLGPGLTPSGDDCLVGWLAGAWTAGAEGRRLAAATGPGLLAAAGERTGPLSRAFLAAALAGQAAEPLGRFAAAPDGPALAGLLALGATSGADLLSGYLLARAALASAGGPG